MRIRWNASSSLSILNIGWFFVIGVVHIVQQLPSVANAQNLSNDLCINAQPTVIGSSSVFTRFNITSATTDLDVADDCLDGNPPSNKGIWFNFTGNGGRIVARACTIPSRRIADFPLPGFSAGISVFTGGCSPSTRQCVAATAYGCEWGRFIFDTTMGTPYHVLVQNAPSLYSSEIVDVSIFEAPPPGNDHCVDAQPVVIGSSSIPIRFDTTYATKDVNLPDDCSLDGNPSDTRGIWLKFTGTGRRIAARACVRDPGCFYRIIAPVSVFSGGCTPSTIQCVAAIAVSCEEELLYFESQLGTTYHVLVQNPFSLVDVSIFEAPRGPTLDPAPANTPVSRAPTFDPTDHSKKCGLFGFNFFCPDPEDCGFFRRLFGINGC